MSHRWTCVYAMDRARRPTDGSSADLANAIRRGADLRLYTTFDWREHMGASLPDQGLVEETIDLRVTYLIEDRWTAALTALRYPANAGLGFGPVPSLSFFMYNETAEFGIARFLFGQEGTGFRDVASGAAVNDYGPHYHLIGETHDRGRAPSHNATYDFNVYRWQVRDDWTEVLSHDERGRIRSGSLDALADAFRQGASIKVAVRDLCRDLASNPPAAVGHEVFVELGSMYLHVERGFHSGESLPLVRIAPGIPLRYSATNWNCGWILPRSDGCVHHLVVPPETRAITRTSSQHAIRWFAR